MTGLNNTLNSTLNERCLTYNEASFFEEVPVENIILQDGSNVTVIAKLYKEDGYWSYQGYKTFTDYRSQADNGTLVSCLFNLDNIDLRTLKVSKDTNSPSTIFNVFGSHNLVVFKISDEGLNLMSSPETFFNPYEPITAVYHCRIFSGINNDIPRDGSIFRHVGNILTFNSFANDSLANECTEILGLQQFNGIGNYSLSSQDTYYNHYSDALLFKKDAGKKLAAMSFGIAAPAFAVVTGCILMYYQDKHYDKVQKLILSIRKNSQKLDGTSKTEEEQNEEFVDGLKDLNLSCIFKNKFKTLQEAELYVAKKSFARNFESMFSFIKNKIFGFFRKERYSPVDSESSQNSSFIEEIL